MRQSLFVSISLAVIVFVVAALLMSAPDPATNGNTVDNTPNGSVVHVPTATIAPAAQQSTPTQAPPAATSTAVDAVPSTPEVPLATSAPVEPQSGASAALQQEEPEFDPFVDQEVVIKLFSAADLESVAADYQLDAVPLGQFGSRAIFRMRIIDGESPETRSEQLQADARVEYAEPNLHVRAPEWRSRYSWARFDEKGEEILPWVPEFLNLYDAHAVSTGEGVVVAVLDTGIDATHPDFDNRLVPGFDFVDFDDDPREEGGFTDETPAYGHGTHVAGLVLQVAPDARIMPVRVLGPRGEGNIWVLAEAIAFAADPDGDPTTPDGAQIINLSLGTPRRTSLLEDIVREISCEAPFWFDDDDDDDWDDDDDGDWDDDDWDDDDDAWDDDDWDDHSDDDGNSAVMPVTSNDTCNGDTRGIVVVASAGNSGTDEREYPAAEDIPGLLSVASSTPHDMLAEGSSFGEWVNVAAPGVDIVSTMPQGEYGAMSGTSMAAALVSGHAALVMERYPAMTSKDVEWWIRQTATPIEGSVPWRIDPPASLGELP